MQRISVAVHKAVAKELTAERTDALGFSVVPLTRAGCRATEHSGSE